jgi:TPR repeat protein
LSGSGAGEWERAVNYYRIGAEIGYELAADNAIWLIENDVFGGSGWPKAFRHTMAESADPLILAVEGREDAGALMDAVSAVWRRLTTVDVQRGEQLLQRWLGVLVALYQHASDSENTEAMLQLGNLHYYGYITSIAAGTNSTTPFAGCGRPRGCVALAQSGRETHQLRFQRAMQWYSDARDLGSSQATFEIALGRLHLGTPGVLQHLREFVDANIGTAARNDPAEWSAAMHRAEGLRLLRGLASDSSSLSLPEPEPVHEESDDEDFSWLAAASSWVLTGWSPLDYSHAARRGAADNTDAQYGTGDQQAYTDADADAAGDDRVRLLSREMAEGYFALYGTEVGGRHSVIARRRRYYDSLAARY